MNEYKRITTLVLTSGLLAACAPVSSPNTENWRYDIEIGFTTLAGDHVVASSLIIRGNGSHKGTPGIYASDGGTVMPFVDRGPCAAGSPCWTGVAWVPRDGQHEFTIEAAVDLTPAEWRILAGAENESHQLYCRITRDGKTISMLDNTGTGYAVKPIQNPGAHSVTCDAHN